MKTTLLKLFSVLAISTLLISCAAVHNGYMANSVSLSSANFSYIKKGVKAESTAKYILGIGGLAKETLVDDAKQILLANNPLKSNQALANLTVNFKSSFYLEFYRTVRCTITADIVEFK